MYHNREMNQREEGPYGFFLLFSFSFLEGTQQLVFFLPKPKGVSGFCQTSKETELALDKIWISTYLSSACIDYDKPVGDSSLILKGQIKEVGTGMSYFWDFLLL